MLYRPCGHMAYVFSGGKTSNKKRSIFIMIKIFEDFSHGHKIALAGRLLQKNKADTEVSAL